MPIPVEISTDRLLVRSMCSIMTDAERVIMDRWLLTSAHIWVGIIHGQSVCAWGLVAPTLLSSDAYLWMYGKPVTMQERFLLARHSRPVVAEMLSFYNVLYGHVRENALGSCHWLEWLDAEFGEVVNGYQRFEIRRQDG